MMKMSRFGATNAAESAKHDAATTPRLPARPSMLSSRLKAFVRPTSQSMPIAQASVGLETNSTEIVPCSTMYAASELGAELGGRDAGGRRRRAGRTRTRSLPPATTGSISPTIPTGPIAGREQDGDGEAGEDADPAERRRRARVPAVGTRIGPERPQRSRPAQQAGDDEERDRRGREGGERVHGLQGCGGG